MATTAEFYLPISVNMDDFMANNFPGATIIQRVRTGGHVKITVSQNLNDTQKSNAEAKLAAIYTKIIWT